MLSTFTRKLLTKYRYLITLAEERRVLCIINQVIMSLNKVQKNGSGSEKNKIKFCIVYLNFIIANDSTFLFRKGNCSSQEIDLYIIISLLRKIFFIWNKYTNNKIEQIKSICRSDLDWQFDFFKHAVNVNLEFIIFKSQIKNCILRGIELYNYCSSLKIRFNLLISSV